ncbi:MAG: hypothetical protein KatS3mg035_2215 [Bacteroidia bacterium]|nr:MAG: hypothetical protein KatS3mg035_2215 [Bacteroidia bacterium]
MVLMKKKEKKWKKIINGLIGFFLFLAFLMIFLDFFLGMKINNLFQFNFFNYCRCSSLDTKIKKIMQKKPDRDIIKLKEVTDFQWDNLFVIVGPRFPDEIQNIIGFKYENEVSDNEVLFIFTKNYNFIKEFKSSFCCDIDWSNCFDKNGYFKLTSHSKILIKQKPLKKNSNKYIVICEK